MMFAFFLCRILVFPFMYTAYGVKYDLSLLAVLRHIPFFCNIGCLVIFIPQFYWMALMVVGAFKLIKNHKKCDVSDKNGKID